MENTDFPFSSTKSSQIEKPERQEALVQKLNKKPSFKTYETKTDVSIISNESYNDLYSIPTSHHNLILSEESKSRIKFHKPVKVHVSHKPTTTETSRVYNPYSLQNEYEQYNKNGFIFEPISPDGDLAQYKAAKTKLSNPNLNHANAAFSSEAISPYIRKDKNTVVYKNPVNNDKRLDFARGYTNASFDSSTEFQNLNNLKKQKPEYNSKSSYEKNALNKDSDDVDNTSIENLVEVISDPRNRNFYEDEYDVANKYKRKAALNQNTQLISSISKELKKMNSGYQNQKY